MRVTQAVTTTDTAGRMDTRTEPAGTASDLGLLALLQLVSPSLPIGAFAWSQALESAFELGWVRDEEELSAWLGGVLEDGLARCELPLLARFQRAWAKGDGAALRDWNSWLHATRETAELAAEDVALGAALLRLLSNLGQCPPADLAPAEPVYTCIFAWAAQRHGLAPRDTLLGFSWAWLENQLAAACKALPLGHTAAQRIAVRLRPVLADAVQASLALEDRELGPMLPGLALASAQHETQYSRLFRS